MRSDNLREMQACLWKTIKKWEKSFNFISGKKHYSVELVCLKRWCGEELCIFTNGLQIHHTTFKRLNGLAVCSRSEQHAWVFDGRSFLLMVVPGVWSMTEYHLLIDGLQIERDLTPSELWRRRGWVLVYFGLIEVLIGILLESIRYFEDTVPYFVLWELLGRVLLIFGLLKIVEGLTSHVAIHSNRYGPVYTV